jgi:hypothetical protein
MEYKRIKNPDISLHILPFFVEGGDETPVEIGMRLNDLMREDADNTFVLTAVKDEMLMAVLLAYSDDNGITIWQFKKSKDMDRPQQMIHKMYEWARSKGAKEVYLKCHDKRLRRLYRRKYGFSNSTDNLMRKAI